jgi:isopentenyl diphosphate isomerase/L-lactate dehydrogenase-like FMN-dependent dehydrogenase
MHLEKCLNVADLRAEAKRRLPKAIFEFIDRGTEDEIALFENRRSLDEIKLRHRALIDVSGRSTKSLLFGKSQAAPIAISPTGSAGLCWFEGELELAKAAAVAGIPYTMASGAMTSIEKVAKYAGPDQGGRLWFQIYLWKERDYSYELIARARRAGFEALIVTVDSPVLSNREYNARNGFLLPFHITARFAKDIVCHPGWMWRVLRRYLLRVGMPRNENYPDHLRNISEAAAADIMRGDTLSWKDIAIIREQWPGILILKGINHPDDARTAIEYGVDSIIVSNHGGRNMDSSPPAIDLLPEISDVFSKHGNVLFDSGIRRGSDIVKALALGAKAALIGRPVLYGTSVAGMKGALRAIDILTRELDRAMAFTGCRSVDDVGPEILFRKRNSTALSLGEGH